MIQLYNDYVILNDDVQWILAKDVKRVDKRSGRPEYDTVGYFRKLGEAINEFRLRNIRALCKNESLALNDALRAIKNENERLEKFIRDNIPDA